MDVPFGEEIMRPIMRTTVLATYGLLAAMLFSNAQDGIKKIPVGNNVVVEIEGKQKRVVVSAYVCLRQGMLEQLLTRKRTKEHEAILAVDADARNIHTALLYAGAQPGSPVKFRPKFTAPTGGEVKITLQYQEKGKTVRVPAQQWVRNVKTKKDLDTDWVFAGSVLIPDPIDKKKQPYYGANDGDLICISNFDTAMLDVPFNSPKDNDDLAFEAHTDRIPPLETPVLVILEPVPAKK
jgi:hypothetical protein